MSDATESALRDALQAHIRDINDDGQAVVTDYVAAAACFRPGADDEPWVYSMLWGNNQPLHATRGLTEALREEVENFCFVAAMDGDDDA